MNPVNAPESSENATPTIVKAAAPSLLTRLGRRLARLRDRLHALFERYGGVAIATYFAIFVGTWATLAVAMWFGLEVESTAEEASIVGASWLVTKVTQPVRILATLALTPVVAGIWERRRGGGPRLGGL